MGAARVSGLLDVDVVFGIPLSVQGKIFSLIGNQIAKLATNFLRNNLSFFSKKGFKTVILEKGV